MQSILKTPPVVEPLSVSDVLAHLNMSEADSTEEAYLATLIVAARQACEAHTDSALLTQTRLAYAPDFDCDGMDLPCAPLQSIAAVRYYDEANILRELATDLYFVSLAGARSRVVFVDGFNKPCVYVRPDAVQIEYVAGYGDAAADVPAPLRHAMLLMVGSWYAQRESVSESQLYEVPHAVTYLLSPFKNFDGMLV